MRLTFDLISRPLLCIMMAAMSACASAPQASPTAAVQATAPKPAATTAAPAVAPTTAAPAAAATPAPAALKGQITYAWWGASAVRNEATQKVISLFQQKNPNVKIDPSIADFNTHFQKLTVAAAANDLPCLPQMQSTALAQFADPKILRPLDDLVASKVIDTTNVPQGVVDTGRGFDGKLYMVPTGVFSRANMYNDALLQQSGVAPPAETWTWDQHKALMTEVQAKLPRDINAVVNNGGDMNPLVTWVLSHGEPVFQQKALGFTKPTLAAWFEYWEDLRKAGVATSETEVAERQQPLELQAVATGAAVFGSYAPNQVAAIQGALTKAGKPGTIVIIKEPNGPGGSGDAIGTNGLTIGANCDNVSVAAAFIDFFLNDAEGAAAYKSDNGAVSSQPLLLAQINDPTAAPTLLANLKFQQHLTSGGFVKDIKYAAGYSALPPLLTTTYQNVAFGRMSIAAAVDDFFNQANAILNK
jgi:multiple sugar transport system substrate-binding protein